MYHNGKDIKKFCTKDCGINNIPNDEMDNLNDILSKLPILNVSFKLYSLGSSLKRIYNKPNIENSDFQIKVHLKKNNDIKNNLIVYSLYGKSNHVDGLLLLEILKQMKFWFLKKFLLKKKFLKTFYLLHQQKLIMILLFYILLMILILFRSTI